MDGVGSGAADAQGGGWGERATAVSKCAAPPRGCLAASSCALPLSLASTLTPQALAYNLADAVQYPSAAEMEKR